MDGSTDYHFLTANMQKILLLIYEKKQINFEKQNIFKCKKWFKEVMNKLIRFEKVEKHNGIDINSLNRKIEYYTLTFTGKLFVEKSIIDFNEKNR